MVVSTKNGVKNGLRKNLKALSQRDSPSANNTFFVFRTKFSRWFVQLDFDSHFSKNPHLQTEKYTVKNWVWKNPRALSQRESPSANNTFFFSPRNASLVQNSVDCSSKDWMLVEIPNCLTCLQCRIQSDNSIAMCQQEFSTPRKSSSDWMMSAGRIVDSFRNSR